MDKKINSYKSLTLNELERYSRHITLKEIGKHGQEKLKASSIICVGAGGIGSSLLMYLAAGGVGRIGIADNDYVDLSNLQRQVIHKDANIGRLKTISAKERIIEINPNCIVDIYNLRVSKDNILNLISSYDIVCDCTDNFPSRFLINDACVIQNKPYVYGSVQGFTGHISVFNLNDSSPNYRDLIPEAPPTELAPDCSENGVIGVIPGIVGMIQATEIIKIITNIGISLDGKLMVFNGLTMNFKTLNLLSHNKNRSITNLNDFADSYVEDSISESSYEVINIKPKDMKNLFNKNSETICVLDVRNKPDKKYNIFKNMISIKLRDIEKEKYIKKLIKISKDKQIYTICQRGFSSVKASVILKKHNINAINIQGGFEAFSG
tara:strand:- start:35304 stop:36440 length:1137 start_codon:yes stop_codon:yes gene_type:complete